MKKMTIRIATFMLAVVVAITNVYAFDYEFNTTQNGIQVSNNRAYAVESAVKYGEITRSYIDQNDEGIITRLEVINGNVFVEKYTADYEYISTKQLPYELPRFGGAFFGASYNFLVFVQDNYNEHNDREIMRVIKYDKDWNAIKSLSYYGMNTNKPISSSGLSMVEKNGVLYIKTSHRMYTDPDDGANHQASMSYGVNQETMESTGAMYKLDYKDYGYVSHSFQQLLTTNGEEIFSVDLGDAFPRSIVLFRGQAIDRTKKLYNTNLFNIPGTLGQNGTGINLGGIEYTSVTETVGGEEVVEEPTENPTEEPTENPTEEPTENPTENPTEEPTEDPVPTGQILATQTMSVVPTTTEATETVTTNSVIVAGRMESEYNDNSWKLNSHIRDIFITVADILPDNKMASNEIIKITNYTRAEGIKTTTPKLVKVNDAKLFVMWQEYTGSISEVTDFKFVEIDNRGNLKSEIMTGSGMLSDCQPIVRGDKVLWYATANSVPTFYTFDVNTYETKANVAIGTTYAYEKIVVPYEEEKPKDTTGTDNGNGTGTGTDGTDNGDGTGTDGTDGTDNGDGTGTDGTDGTDNGDGTGTDGTDGTDNGDGTETDGTDETDETDNENETGGNNNVNASNNKNKGSNSIVKKPLTSTKKEEKVDDSKVTKIQEKIKNAKLKEDAKNIKFVVIKKGQNYIYPNNYATRYSVIKSLNNLFDLTSATSGTSFNDVENLSSEDSSIIESFSNAQIVNGYNDGNFKPENSITRAEFATILSKMLELDTNIQNNNFNDLNNHWAKDSIAVLSQAGYINGYPDGTFKPDEKITNAEVIVILNRVKGADDSNIESDTSISFDDLPQNHWAKDEILKSVSIN